MITVHHLEHSRSERVLWLLEELEQPYELQKHARHRETMLAPEGLRAIHPLGKSPTVVDDGRVVVESGAILEYLLARYGEGRLKPAADDTDAWLRYQTFLHYAEGSLMPLMLLTLVFERVENAPVPFFVKPIAKRIAGEVRKAFVRPQSDLHLGYLDDELAARPYFAGQEFTAADIQMTYPLEAAVSRGAGVAQRYPHLVAFLERMHARPAYQRARERGGDFGVP